MDTPHTAGVHVAANGEERARRPAAPGPWLRRVSRWRRAAVNRMSLALAAPATRREALLWGLLLLGLLLTILQWNHRTVIVVPVSENPRAVIT